MSNISEDKKADYLADIETIKSQLARKNPDRDIIKRAWERIEKLSTLEGFVQLLDRAWKFLKPLLGG